MPPLSVGLPLVIVWCWELNLKISHVVLGAGCEVVLAAGDNWLGVGHEGSRVSTAFGNHEFLRLILQKCVEV